ncbi:hypothetical protein [Sorangium sp. So ce426]|uniref:hypothetical protein n=1 Tax=Sorangium sp. So ce426 TaxID=3133312 RepID=UPI003F5C9EEE
MTSTPEHPLLGQLFTFLEKLVAARAMPSNTARVRRTGLRRFFQTIRELAPEVYAEEDPRRLQAELDRIEMLWKERGDENPSTIATYASRTRATLADFIYEQEGPNALAQRSAAEPRSEVARQSEAVRRPQTTGRAPESLSVGNVHSIPMGPGRRPFMFVAPHDFAIQDVRRIVMYLLSISPDFDTTRPARDQIFPSGGGSE